MHGCEQKGQYKVQIAYKEWQNKAGVEIEQSR